MVQRLEQLNPVQAELRGIHRDRNPEIIKELCLDEEFKKSYEKVQMQLKKKFEKDKEDNKNFFIALNMAAELKDYHHLLADLAVIQKTIEERQAEEKFQDKERYEKKLHQQYVENARIEHPPLDITLARSLVQKAKEISFELKAIMMQYNHLLNQTNQWPEKTWKPEVKKLAEDAVVKIMDLAKNENYHALLEGINQLENKDQINKKIAGKWTEAQQNMTDALSTRAAPDALLRAIPQLNDQYQEALKQTSQVDSDPLAAKEAAVETVIVPVYKLHGQLNAAGNIRQFYDEFRKICSENLGKEYEEKLKSWSSVKLATHAANNPDFHQVMQCYQDGLCNLYETQWQNENKLENLAQQQNKLKIHLVDVVEQLHRIAPPKPQPSSKQAPRPSF